MTYKSQRTATKTVALNDLKIAVAAADIADHDTIILDKASAKRLLKTPNPETVARLIAEAQCGSLVSAATLVKMICSIELTDGVRYLGEGGYLHSDYDYWSKEPKDPEKRVEKALKAISDLQQILR